MERGLPAALTWLELVRQALVEGSEGRLLARRKLYDFYQEIGWTDLAALVECADSWEAIRIASRLDHLLKEAWVDVERLAHHIEETAAKLSAARRNGQLDPEGQSDSNGEWHPTEAEAAGSNFSEPGYLAKWGAYNDFAACCTQEHCLHLITRGLCDLPHPESIGGRLDGLAEVLSRDVEEIVRSIDRRHGVARPRGRRK